MGLPLRTLLYPLFDRGDFRRLHLFVFLRRRHDFVAVIAGDALVERTLVRFPFHHSRPVVALRKKAFFTIKAQTFLACARIGSVAMVAILPEDGTHIAVKADAILGREQRQSSCKRCAKGKCEGIHIGIQSRSWFLC